MDNTHTMVKRRYSSLRSTIIVLPVAIIAIFASVLSSTPAVIAQTDILSPTPAPANIQVINGTNAGEAVVTWDAVEGANFYRIGWLSRTDYQAAGDDWLERFAFSDVEGKTSYTVSRLTPSEYYWFIVASNASRYGAPMWPEDWVPLTLNADDENCPTPELTPTPLPSTGDGSKRSSPIPYGQKFEAGNFDMQITGVDEDAWPEILAENQFNDPPDTGYRYVMWTINVENKRGSVDDDLYISDYSFNVVGSLGVKYPTSDLKSYCGVIPEDLSASLYLGGTTEGNVCFAVPIDETGLTFLYDTYHSDASGDSFRVEVWFAASPP